MDVLLFIGGVSCKGGNCESSCACFFFVDDATAEDLAICALKLPFEIPTRPPVRSEKYEKVQLTEEFYKAVPSVVSKPLLEVMGIGIPIDVQMPLAFLREGRLPEFVVAWFLSALPKSRLAQTTRFYQALRAIENYREYIWFERAKDILPFPAGVFAPHNFVEEDSQENLNLGPVEDSDVEN